MNGALFARHAFIYQAVLVFMLCGCDDPGSSPKDHSLTVTSGWNCSDATNCQDVYDFVFTEASIVSFSLKSISPDSIPQMALYGPGIPLGGINLFTLTMDELRRAQGDSCDDYPAGTRHAAFLKHP